MPPSFVPAPRAASRRPCRFIRLNFTLSEARGTIIPGGRAATGRFRPRRPPAAGAVPLCTAARPFPSEAPLRTFGPRARAVRRQTAAFPLSGIPAPGPRARSARQLSGGRSDARGVSTAGRRLPDRRRRGLRPPAPQRPSEPPLRSPGRREGARLSRDPDGRGAGARPA